MIPGPPGGPGWNGRGPRLRTDIVELYILRPQGATFDLLQLRRVEPPLAGTWQPVMGHIEAGETSGAAAAREAGEELALNLADPQQCTDLFALEQVHPFFIAEMDAVFLTPRLVGVVTPSWEPRMNGEHDAFRWTPVERAGELFMWPGQRAAVAELVDLLRPSSGATLAALRVDRSSLVR